MKRALILITLVAIVMGMVCPGYASKEDDAKALAQRVAAFVKDNGRDKGIKAIMNPADPFKRGKCNVSLNEFTGLNLANVLFPALIGQNHYTLQDANGKLWIKGAIEIAKAKGAGWFDLSFTDPETKKIVPWKGYVQRVEGADLAVMVFFQAAK